MKKVMLVDDEIFITEGLISIINWNQLGIEVVQTAQNGEEALQKFQDNPVDIIVTDINMPLKTGLELVKEINELNDKVKFIILSGYDEFSYAKKAIEYGVEDYILKPVDEEELECALKKLLDNMAKEKKMLNKGLDKTEKWLTFLNNKSGIENIKAIKNEIHLSLERENYTISHLFIDTNEKKDLYVNIDSYLEKVFNHEYEVIYCLDGHSLIINSWDKDMTDIEIFEKYNSLKELLKNNLNYNVFISVGCRVNSINEVRKSYISSKKLKKYMLTEGMNRVINENSISTINYKGMNFKGELEQINKLMIEKNSTGLKESVEKIFNHEDLTPKNIYEFSIKILLLIDSVLEEFNVDKKYERENLYEAITELCNENTRENIMTFIIRELEEFIQTVSKETIKYSPVVQQIVNAVNERYYEELSLKTLAHQYNINSSYLGQIFNKEVGCSFSDYLNKTKNMKAKQLILETNMKINDIAKEVGYTDSSYFYRKFKKFFGVSPSNLREMKNY